MKHIVAHIHMKKLRLLPLLVPLAPEAPSKLRWWRQLYSAIFKADLWLMKCAWCNRYMHYRRSLTVIIMIIITKYVYSRCSRCETSAVDCLILVSAAARHHQTTSSPSIPSVKHHSEQASPITHYQITPYSTGAMFFYAQLLANMYTVVSLLVIYAVALYCRWQSWNYKQRAYQSTKFSQKPWTQLSVTTNSIRSL